ncbi:hypothetical protein [uncultured Capnocytophaga sp.]|uniref:hypothetical protein n=1 Tax=uncultured Capnocytophaga sp. TaxID=159273 RepID=UPI0026159792|nr:hypothetical protein [uncultured Capnocytophaga sp.]
MYKYFYKNLYKIKYGLFYLIDDNIFFINLKNSFCNKNIEILQGECVINYLYKGFIYLWNNNEKLIFDINNSILKKHNNDTYPIKDVYSSKKKYYITYKENDIITLLEYNEGNYEEILENINFSFIIGDLFYDISNKIVCFNTEKTIWQYDLETYFHQSAQIMEGRVLVSDNRIIFFAHTEDWSNYATFVLDAQTGQVLNNPKETIFGGKMYLFDGFLWQKKDKGFAKMNPETFEITHYDLTKDLPTEIIDNRTMAYHNGIIAVSAKPERDSIRSLVLLFDTNTGKIIWRKEILHNESKPSNNENRRQIEEMQMNDKYLAVSTTGFSLYIFEKQDVESK